MTSDKSPLLYTVPRLLIFIPYRHLRHRWLIHIPWVAPGESPGKKNRLQSRDDLASHVYYKGHEPLCARVSRENMTGNLSFAVLLSFASKVADTRGARGGVVRSFVRSFDGWPSRKRARQANERLTSSLASVISSPIRVEFSFLSRDRSGKIS